MKYPGSYIIVLIILVFLTSRVSAQKMDWTLIPAQTDASFRGLSVVDNHVAWVSGSKGWVGKTVDGGRTWKFAQVKGFEKLEFRSLYAFDARHAIVANAGSPANIMVTMDGGLSWNNVYTHPDTTAFFDGIEFVNDKVGYLYGDPINGKMLLLKTSDGGKTWTELASEKRPALNEGEASFAASGTNIRILQDKTLAIATGGTVSRLWFLKPNTSAWSSVDCPILQGQSSTGIFSFIFYKPGKGVIVGGDYLKDKQTINHVFLTNDGGKTWQAPSVPTRGYRECVEYLGHKILIATGPSGTDLSLDEGKTWDAESDEPLFHVVRKARKGNLIIVAGGKGKLALLKIKK